MSALAFVTELQQTGRVKVPAAMAPPADLDAAAAALDAAARLELAGDPPPLSPPAAR